MNKNDIYKFIKGKNIWYEITEHKAAFNMEDLAQINLPYPEYDAKNLFVRDEKKENYYLITIKSHKRVDLKDFRTKYNTKRLSFASESDLFDILNLVSGSVSPLGLLNDKDLKVTFYLDEEFTKDKALIGVHPNENTATIWLKTKDLIDIIKEHGNIINIVSFD